MPTPDKIRVLIVDDVQETRDNIRRMLQFESIIEVIGTAQNGREAIDAAIHDKPDVVIMDINMPDIDGISATELIRKKVPFTQIIVLSVQSDPGYMRRAMLAGARDFLTKPPMIDDLVSAVKRAGQMAFDERAKSAVQYPGLNGESPQTGRQLPLQKGKIIVVYSPKGGVGTSTIAVNLAAALLQGDSKVILVDGNLQYGDVAVLLNEQGKNNLIDLTQRVEELDPEIIEEVVVKHSSSNLNILACPPRPELAESITGEQFGTVLQYIRQIYNYVVVDTASYLTEVVQTAIENADQIILVTTQDIPSIKSCNLFISLASAIGIKNRLMFVMNRYDKRLKISPEKVGGSLHQEIVMAIPYEEKAIPNSVNRGVPFVLENKTLPVSKNFLSLAEMIQKKFDQIDNPKEELIGKK
jgi:pilus assembly protein CpaE